MKHAFLIYAHEDPFVLHILLNLLDDERNEIFLHIDPRQQEAMQTALNPSPLRHARLHLIQPAMAVSWGDFSQIEVEIRLYAAARRQGGFAYYHLLSGVDLPLKSMDELHAFFATHAGKEFVGFWNSETHRHDVQRRAHRYYLFTRYLKRQPHRWRHRLTVPLRNLSLAAQKVVRYRRFKHTEFRKGFNWCSLTEACVDYLLSKREEIEHTFRHMLAPDEIYKQTLIAASPFIHQCYALDDPELGSMRRIDWTRGKPYVWQPEDLPELLAAPHLFARKMAAPTAQALFNHFQP